MKSFSDCRGPASSFGRRTFLKNGLGALLGAKILNWQSALAGDDAGTSKNEPMSCILLWMNGGPSHIDTFDPKPGTKSGGTFRAISTRVEGLKICEHLPLVAEQADKLAVIRSMTSKEGNHDRGRYLMHTGYSPSGTLQHPSFGAWVSHELCEANSQAPHFVCIRGGSVGSGFLGVDHAPLSVQDPRDGLRNLHAAKDVDQLRFAERQRALTMLQDDFARKTQRSEIADLSKVYDKARRLMSAPSAKAFQIESEPMAVQNAYGKTPFGQGCLMARRLIESGVRFVEVTLDGWDTHYDNFSQVKSLCKELDPAYSTLLKDLKERDLLRRTLVIWMGEFGRTPNITARDGRDHYPAAWSAVLSGGNIRAGYVHGSTNAEGSKVESSPVKVPDFFATLATAMHMNPKRELMSPIGRPIALSENGSVVKELLQG